MQLRPNGQYYRLATSVDGPVTGKGAHFAIVDDPFKAAEAASERVGNDVCAWLKESIMTRFDMPAEAGTMVIHQRLHQDDLIGRLLAEGGWKFIQMPGECVEQQMFDLDDGETWIFEPGDLLFEERFNRAALDQLFFDFGEAAYNAQILQRPSQPGGNLFKLKQFRRYEALPASFELIVQSWDPAVVDTETAAFTVCTTWDIVGQKLYLIDVLSKHMVFAKIEDEILAMRVKYNAGAVVLEVAGVGAAIGNSLLKRPGTRPWMWAVNPILGKNERAMRRRPRLSAGELICLLLLPG